jgi:S-adenosylmethionine:tRNA ribosyltransferase-isomerase
VTIAAPELAFSVPPELEAHSPPEARGLVRDAVRLMVAFRAERELVDARFRTLPSLLEPGDVVVVNTSRTLPAAVPALRPDGSPVTVHFSTHVDDGRWAVELRRDDAPLLDAHAGELVELQGGASAELRAPYAGPRLWEATIRIAGSAANGAAEVHHYLHAHGRPIRYAHVDREWRLERYQTVYASVDGSAEMPSAGRAFSARLIAELVARGVEVAPIVLHCGVSSPGADEPPYPERFEVPASTARRVNAARAAGGRVIAVGTTVVRALESAAGADGTVRAAGGWTDLVIDADRGVAAIDGLVTGWHEPRASHLALVEAVAGGELLARSYEAALERGYLWHEFGDLLLILPARSV